MCGRFGFKGSADDFEKVFGYAPRPEQLANYNIAPTTSILYGEKDGHGEAHWGLVWKGAKDAKWAPINARAETLEWSHSPANAKNGSSLTPIRYGCFFLPEASSFCHS